MMSDPAIDVTRAWFETWNRGDMEAFATCMRPTPR